MVPQVPVENKVLLGCLVVMDVLVRKAKMGKEDPLVLVEDQVLG